jgi:hypothetical protein
MSVGHARVLAALHAIDSHCPRRRTAQGPVPRAAPLSWKAGNRLRIFTPAQALEGEDLRRFLEVHAELVQLTSKMQSILGE